MPNATSDTVIVEDLFFRRDNGPVQHVRVWDRTLFIETRLSESMNIKQPWKFSLANASDYAAERKRHAHR